MNIIQVRLVYPSGEVTFTTLNTQEVKSKLADLSHKMKSGIPGETVVVGGTTVYTDRLLLFETRVVGELIVSPKMSDATLKSYGLLANIATLNEIINIRDDTNIFTELETLTEAIDEIGYEKTKDDGIYKGTSSLGEQLVTSYIAIIYLRHMGWGMLESMIVS